jgi:hypothetical protein
MLTLQTREEGTPSLVHQDTPGLLSTVKPTSSLSHDLSLPLIGVTQMRAYISLMAYYIGQGEIANSLLRGRNELQVDQ